MNIIIIIIIINLFGKEGQNMAVTSTDVDLLN